MQYRDAEPRDFLATATPGAGKTTFALAVARHLLDNRICEAVTVVTPTDHLRTQWADAALRLGVSLDPTWRNGAGALSHGYHGRVVTYAQVAAAPEIHRAATSSRRTLVVLDEIHHAGDALSWGQALRYAYDDATKRLSLSGTPYRSDQAQIPWTTYEPDGTGLLCSRADFGYGYGEALREGVVRPVMFMAYGGTAAWVDHAGQEQEGSLSDPDQSAEQISRAWRAVLDPRGDWIPQVLRDADARLTDVRRVIPDAGGLVLATDQDTARAYAAILDRITGEKTTVVLSDDPQSSKKLEVYGRSNQRWISAVRQVSEGVDVPRLAVGVYATSSSTPLFFAQAIGRFVRAREPREVASVFLPAVPHLMELAGELEVQRDHVLAEKKQAEDEVLGERLDRQRSEDDEERQDAVAEVVETIASFDRIILDGRHVEAAGVTSGVSADGQEGWLFGGEEDELGDGGLPGLLSPEQTAALMQSRQAERLKKERAVAAAEAKSAAAAGVPMRVPLAPMSSHRVRADLRTELNGLVGAIHHKTSLGYGTIHADMRKACGGPAPSQCSEDQLVKRIGSAHVWLARGRSSALGAR